MHNGAIACEPFSETPNLEIVMRALYSLLTLVAFAVCPVKGRADGLIYKLPPDGTRVTYELSAVHSQGGNDMKIAGTLAVASVGKKTVDKTACRWIEFTMKMEQGGRERTVIAKLLIPESDLGKGKYALSNVKQGWLKQRDNVKELNDPNSRDGGPVPAFLPNPLKDVKEAKPAEIETGAGKMSAKKLTGKTEYEQGDANRTSRFTVDYELQLANKAPFGVAGGKMTMKRYRDRKTLSSTITIDLKLKSIDKKAKSGLPDKN
jgi:hypothetical protein